MTATTNSSFPAELQQMPNWVFWKLEERGDKSTKVPYTIDGYLASTADPSTWTTFSNASDAFIFSNYDGLGCVIQPPYVGIDLDKCRDPQTKVVEPWAMEAITMLNSYTELSPSGCGFHVWVKGTLPGGGNRNGRVEVYTHGRYFTVTHQHVDGTPTTINECDLTEFHTKFIRNSKTAVSSSDTSPSAKEFALACAIVHDLGAKATEAEITIEFFRRGTERPKWTENKTYVSRTIQAAISKVRGATALPPASIPRPVSAPAAMDKIADPEPGKASEQNSRDELKLDFVPLSQIDAEIQEWLWENRIPKNALTNLSGDADKGKSLTLYDILARISKGADFPDGAKNPFGGRPKKVLLMFSEGSLKTTVKPRMMVMGANMDNVIALKSVSRKGEKDRPSGSSTSKPI